MTIRTGLLTGLALAGLVFPNGATAQTEEAHYRLVVVLPGQGSMAGEGTFIDDADIQRDGDVRVFSSVQAFTADPDHPELNSMAYLRVGMRVNCATRMLETLRFTGYSENGRIIRDGPANDTRPVQVSPTSSAAAFANYVCDGTLEPAKARVRPLTLREILDASRRIREMRNGAAR